MRPSLATVFRKAPAVRARNVGDEAVVVHQSAGEVFVLNHIASRVLELADGKTPVDAMIDTLLGEYDVERDVLERDVLTFSESLEDAGVIKRVELAS